jgi:hypothetical protein
MKGRSVSPLRLACAVFLTAGLCLIAAAGASAANNSEQVVFSKTGAFSTALGPLGLWVWCEAESENPYAGVCSGSVYFYFLGVPRGVHGFITEAPADPGLYTMTLFSADRFIDACQFMNPEPATSGPTNDLALGTCTVGGQRNTNVGEVVTTTAVVRVTGP